MDKKNCLIVDGEEFTFEEVLNFIDFAFSNENEEWYAPVNCLTKDSFNDIVDKIKYSRRVRTKEAWQSAVVANTTEMSLEEWMTER